MTELVGRGLVDQKSIKMDNFLQLSILKSEQK
jgi:hypothetical protein